MKRLEIVFTTEDGSAAAPDVMEALLDKTLRAVCARTGWHGEWTLHPLPENLRRAASATVWRARRGPDQPRRAPLVRYLADHLAKGADAIVVFHYDGDCRWTERPSSAAAAFDTLIRTPIGHVGGSRVASSRLVEWVPYWELESWLYQHTRECVAICEERGDPLGAGHFAEIARARAVLDEVEHPHEDPRFRTVGKGHNLRLASSNAFPADAVWRVGASYADAAARLTAAITGS